MRPLQACRKRLCKLMLCYTKKTSLDVLSNSENTHCSSLTTIPLTPTSPGIWKCFWKSALSTSKCGRHNGNWKTYLNKWSENHISNLLGAPRAVFLDTVCISQEDRLKIHKLITILKCYKLVNNQEGGRKKEIQREEWGLIK